MNDKITLEEINRALGAFLLCFGAGLPKPLKQSIRARCHALSEQIENAGEPNVAKLARGYADALTGQHPPPSSH